MSSSEKVNHPSHYNKGKFEVIDVIEDWKLGFHLGNAVKYIARAEHKGNNVEDLRKAAWYINREIQRLGGSGDESGLLRKIGSFDDAPGFVIESGILRDEADEEVVRQMIEVAKKDSIDKRRGISISRPDSERRGYSFWLDFRIPYGEIWEVEPWN